MRKRQNQLAAQQRLLDLMLDPNNKGLDFNTIGNMMGIEPDPLKQLIQVGKIGILTREQNARNAAQLGFAQKGRGQAFENLLDPLATPEQEASAANRADFFHQQAAASPLNTPEDAARASALQFAGAGSNVLTQQLGATRAAGVAAATREAGEQETIRKEERAEARAKRIGSAALLAIEASTLSPERKETLRNINAVTASASAEMLAAGVTVSAGAGRTIERLSSVSTAAEGMQGLLRIFDADPGLAGAGGAVRRRVSQFAQGAVSLWEAIPGSPTLPSPIRDLRTFVDSSAIDIESRGFGENGLFETEEDMQRIRARANEFIVDGATIGTIEALSFHINFAMARLFADTGRVSVAVLERLERFNGFNRLAGEDQNIRRMQRSLGIILNKRQELQQLLDYQGLGGIGQTIGRGLSEIGDLGPAVAPDVSLEKPLTSQDRDQLQELLR